VSGELHTPAALLLGNEPTVPIPYDAGVDVAEKGTFLVLAKTGSRFLGRRAHNLVARGILDQNVFMSVGISKRRRKFVRVWRRSCLLRGQNRANTVE
jgi:hypothetical protein